MNLHRTTSICSIALGFLLLALAPAATTCGQEVVDQAKFVGTMDAGGTVNGRANFSDDGRAVTAIFDDLAIALGGTESELLTATKTATLIFPVSGNLNGVTFTHHLRGFADTMDDQASLLIRSGGTTQNFDLSGRNGNFFFAVDSTLGTNDKNLVLTIELQATRKTTDPQDGFNIQFDSLDISIKPTGTPPSNCCQPTCCQPTCCQPTCYQPVYVDDCCCQRTRPRRCGLFSRRCR